jgi:hypothetical protein
VECRRCTISLDNTRDLSKLKFGWITRYLLVCSVFDQLMRYYALDSQLGLGLRGIGILHCLGEC